MLRFLTKEPLRGAATLSGIVSLFKIVAYISSGSLIVLWSLLDSLCDVVMSMINFKVEKLSQSDPDRQHPFGHAGFEVVSGLIQAIVITASACFVAINAFEKLFGPPSATQNLEEAILTMIGAAFAGLGISIFLSRHEHSLSRETDKAHYMADFWVNLLSALGLILVLLSNWMVIDTIFAVLAALLAVYQVVPIYKSAFESIVQKELDAHVQQAVVDCVLGTDQRIQSVHRLRSRKQGSTSYVDFHLVLANSIELKLAHSISERAEKNIKELFPEMDILIHIDPEGHPKEEDWKPSYDEQAP